MKKQNKWITVFMYPNKSVQKILMVVLLVLTIFVTGLVYLTGGIQYVYSHGMYIPIILAGVYFGLYGGLIQGLIGGLLLGPFMPIDTETMLMQTPINWLYRVFFFMLIGGIIGYFSEAVKKAYNARIDTLKKDFNTDIPLFMAVFDNNPPHDFHYMMHLKILNHLDIVDLFGRKTYYQALKRIQEHLNELSYDLNIYQKELSSLIITLGDVEDEERAFEKINNTLTKTLVIDDIPLFIETALGITTSSENLKHAFEEAMYASRHAENNYLSMVKYDDSMIPNRNNIKVLGLFNKAIRNDELFLVFQPQIDLNTKDVVGAEAFIRWQSEELGLMKPRDFIPLIEETSLINDLTEWVIKSVFERIHMLMQSRLPTKIAINISAKNLLDEAFYTNVKSWLDDYQISGSYVEFEITEQSLMIHKNISKTFIEKLKHEKISLSIDDFGTGYSSLNELNRYQVSTLKVDQAFVHNCNTDKELCNITQAAINLGKGLSVKTAAEGVQTEGESEYLKNIGCDYAQGNYYSEPLSFDAFQTYLKDHKKKK